MFARSLLQFRAEKLSSHAIFQKQKMPLSQTCNLGGFFIALNARDTSGTYLNRHKFSKFFADGAPDLAYTIHTGAFPTASANKLLFEPNTLTWNISEQAKNVHIRVSSPELDPYQLGVFSNDFRSGDIYVACADETAQSYIFPLGYPLGELLMMNLLGTGLGVLFHASAVILDDKAFLFTGHGGAGKTTIARIFASIPGARIVNDDKVIVRKHADGYWLYGTPWHGDGGYALPDSAPIDRIFILKQAKTNQVESLGAPETVARLFARTFLPLWDKLKVGFTLDFLVELVNSVPCQELSFLPDTSVLDFVLDL